MRNEFGSKKGGVVELKLDWEKLEIALAKQCVSAYSLRKSVSPQTLRRAKQGYEITTKSVGRIAAALKVNVEEIIVQEVS